METLEFTLIRRYFTDYYTIGKLRVDQEDLCDSIEDVVRDLHDINHDGDFNDEGEGKIWGQTAIPYGRYKIEMVYWPKHQRLMPQLQDVPGFTGIFIHSGSTASDTAGCLIFGENKIKGKVILSRYHVNIITNMIRKALAEGQEVFITIKS